MLVLEQSLYRDATTSIQGKATGTFTITAANTADVKVSIADQELYWKTGKTS